MPKISTYSTVTPADGDLILISDASDSSNTKNVTVSTLRSGLFSYDEIYDDTSGNSTSIAVQGTFYKMVTNTAQGLTNDVLLTTDNAGRITNTGPAKTFAITYCVSATAASGSNQHIMFRLAKNGTTISYSETDTVTTGGAGSKAASVSNTALIQLSTGDYIEIWCTNNTSTNALVLEHLNLILRQI
jgi:hypothetical protein